MSERREEFQRRLWATIIGLAAIAIYIVAFIAKNSGKVTIHFIFFSAHIGLIWLLLLGFALGLAGGALGSQLYRRRRGHGAG